MEKEKVYDSHEKGTAIYRGFKGQEARRAMKTNIRHLPYEKKKTEIL